MRPAAAAVGVTILFLLGILGTVGGVAHAYAPTRASVPSSSVATSPSVPLRSLPASTPTPALGACRTGEGSEARTSAAKSPAAHASSTSPPPLYNSQVEPYAVLTGPYAYAAAGAALRDLGYGTVNLTWPGAPSKTNLVAAYMIWALMDDSLPPANGTLNGVNVTGTWTAYATPSPCWSPTYIYTFVADVTSVVKNGLNNLTGFPSGVTSGEDPWEASQTDPMAEGASLVAIYESGASTIHQVTVYTGADTTSAGALQAQLNYSATDAVNATTTYLVADGQLPNNVAVWNGSIIDSNAFPGSDPKATTTKWTYGNLFDTKTFNVTVPLGSNNTTAEVYSDSSDCLTWIGQVLNVGVAPSPPPYAVTFSEQGLTDATEWNVTIGAATHSGTVVHLASAIVFDLGNGTHDFTIPAVPGFAGPSGGKLQVDGGPVYIRVLFHQVLYPLTFNESGLPSGLDWWASITNTTQQLTENSSVPAGTPVALSVGNGTYSFMVGYPAGIYHAKPASGSVKVDGSAVVVNITFVPPPLYNVTLLEQGLPRGTSWGGTAYTNFGTFIVVTSNRTYSLMLPNASLDVDDFSARAVSGYNQPAVFFFTVAGAAETVDVNYSLLFTLNLSETGLPSGTYWYGYLSGSFGERGSESTTATLSFSVTNGSYTFEITDLWGYTATPGSGPAVVSGKNVTVPIVFTLSPRYWLNFTETGLPLGTNWSVKVYLPNDTYVTLYSTSGRIAIQEPNGSFSYTVISISGYQASPASGYLEVEGGPASQAIRFVPVYRVVFKESGLPSGTDWYVEVNGSWGSSLSPSIVFWEANGSQPYTVNPWGSYLPTPSSGSVPVSGKTVTVLVVFASLSSPTFTVTFTESGLPAGTNWSVWLYGYEEWSIGTSLNFTEANGTPDFSVNVVAGYSASPDYGSVQVSGKNVSQAITFTPTSLASFLVTFTETGLPSGTEWWVNITGQAPLSSTETTATISLGNSSYTYAVATLDKEYSAVGSSFEVNGAPVEKTVAFSLVLYAVTFTESGLPSETEWWVNITGEPSLSSSGTTIMTSLPNGSYSYAAAASNHTYSAPGGSVAVHGADASATVQFGTSSSSGPPSFLGGLMGAAGYLGLLAAFLLVIILLLIFGRRRRKKKQNAATNNPPAGPAGTPPPPPAP
jgi:hypothetical protein